MIQMVMLVYLLFTLPVCAFRLHMLKPLLIEIFDAQYNLAFDLDPGSPQQPQFWVDLTVDITLGFDMFLNVR